jgi:hypothetical protein
MLMMPQEITGEKDMERYIELPLGRMNGVDLVLQKVTVCPDTFQKLFCLSPNQDNQLLRWRKGLNYEGIKISKLVNVYGKLHRCRTPMDEFWPIIPLDGLHYPGEGDTSVSKKETLDWKESTGVVERNC